MGRKNIFTKEQKIKAILDYKNGIKGRTQIITNLGINEHAFRTWIALYESIGKSVFDDKPRNRQYTKEFKLQVVNDYLNGVGSLMDLIKKYKIYSESNIRRWIKEYNSSGELKDYKPSIEVYTMKARKTTFEERAEIVNYCITNNNNYSETAIKYSVPYSLVYQWVKKYNLSGIDALKYQKKGPKPKEEFIPTTPEEKLQAELQKLQLENERLKLENEVLKKRSISKNSYIKQSSK